MVATTIHSRLLTLLSLVGLWGHLAQGAAQNIRNLEIAGHVVDIMNPSTTPKGTIMVLPGWSFSRQDWCQKSSLCQKALAAGYRLVLPEMGKSIYSGRFYPETRAEWRAFPDRPWVMEKLIPMLQKEGIFLPSHKNFLLGLSTGGRGVALIALDSPSLWTGAAALSGDFEQTATPQDRLMIGFYGEYAKFPTRWTGEDNPTRRAAEWRTPLYLGHGKQDAIVPVQQTQVFYDALRKAAPHITVKLNLVNAAHDYAYWDAEVANVLAFFAALK